MMITIKCPKCQTDNRYDAEFCRHCGLRLSKDCPKCGASNPHQFTYCTQCGQSLISEPMTPVLEVKEEAKAAPEEPKAEVETKVESKEEVRIVPEEPKPEVEAKEENKEEVGMPPEVKQETPEEEVKQETREELKIDVAMPERVSTGISGLDPLVGGGFLTGKVYLVSGEAGTGKTIFGMQFLYQGLILGENGIYVSTNNKPSQIIVDAESLGWDFRKYARERKLGLLDIAPYFAEILSGKTTTVDIDAVVSDLTQNIKGLGAKRIVIDPIAPLVLGQEYVSSMQEYIHHLVAALENNTGCTAVVTSGIPSGFAALSHYGVEEFVADGVIVLGVANFNGYHVRTLTIKKMRSTFSDLNNHFFEIILQRGMVIRG